MCLELDTLLEIVMNGLLFLACANWATIPCFVDWDPDFDNSQRNSGQKHDSKRILESDSRSARPTQSPTRLVVAGLVGLVLESD